MAAMAAALLGLDPKSKEAAMLLMKGTNVSKADLTYIAIIIPFRCM